MRSTMLVVLILFLAVSGALIVALLVATRPSARPEFVDGGMSVADDEPVEAAANTRDSSSVQPPPSVIDD
jgi:hypothetical protein